MNPCDSYTIKELREILSNLKIPGRSQLKTKPEMCQVLTELGHSQNPSTQEPFVEIHSYLDLPNDLKLELLMNSDTSTVGSLCRVDRAFGELCHDDRVWRRLLERDFGLKERPFPELSYYENYKRYRPILFIGRIFGSVSYTLLGPAWATVKKHRGYEWEEIPATVILPFDPSIKTFYYLHDIRRDKIFPYISSSSNALEPFLQPHTVIESGFTRYS